MRRVWGGALALMVMAGCGQSSASRPPDSSTTTAAATATTATTTTTVDPGLLPQTLDRPSANDPRLQAAAADLFQAIVAGRPDEAMDAFFPLSAYLQVKAIRDPAADWRDRLVAAYQRNILALHAQLGAGAADAMFVSLDIPDGATWVRPGEEFNKIGYWRVYGSQLRYRVAGQAHAFPVFSLISWRGRWYVVHLHSATG